MPENGLKRHGHGGGYTKFRQWLLANSTEIVQYFNFNINYLTDEHQL